MSAELRAPGVFPGDAIYIGGHFRKGGGEAVESLFPADGTLNTIVHCASQEDVTDALKAARAALADPAWCDLLPHRRAAWLSRIADAIDKNKEYLAWLQSRDTGKTLRETTILVGSAADTMRYYAAVAETAEEAITPSRGPYLTLSRFEPIGIIGAITPWNSPIASDVQKLAPALAAGNAVILKPSPWSPLTSLALAQIIDETGLPKGLVSVLPGGAEVGSRLVEDPEIGRIVFTGGTTVGRKIAEVAGKRLVPVSLELGGKSPTIISLMQISISHWQVSCSVFSPLPGSPASRGRDFSCTDRFTRPSVSVSSRPQGNSLSVIPSPSGHRSRPWSMSTIERRWSAGLRVRRKKGEKF